jgi:hypothetical protein
MTMLGDTSPQGTPVTASDVDRWMANMVFAIQAVQRLHAAFDAKFVQAKSAE